MESLKQYFIDSWYELGKVTWPTKNRAINICVLVVSFVLVAAAVIAGIDFVFNKGYAYLLQLAQK
ncbi:preprotein translocase subunit SecE [Candidatus Peregrinibacteria bacterium]|nr:preprotein translocase subunit SecE [Candidatus Peregrinibacteria bacterium]